MAASPTMDFNATASSDLNVARRIGGETPLHRAVHSGYHEVAQLLVGGGAEVNVACKVGRLPLHLAALALRGQKELLKLLTDSGADINVVDKWGKTPLHLAAESGKVTRWQYLIPSFPRIATRWRVVSVS